MDLWMENKPSNSELCTVLEKLIKSWEMEVVEFKEAGKEGLVEADSARSKNRTSGY